MTLRFVGIDPNTGGGGSPTVWVEDESADLVLQARKQKSCCGRRWAEPSGCQGMSRGSPTTRR
jgi:hypothetical protein